MAATPVKEFGGFYAVSPDNSNDLPELAIAIYVGGGAPGDIKADDDQGHTGVTFKAVPVGTTLKGRFKRIYATGTTATFLVAFTSP